MVDPSLIIACATLVTATGGAISAVIAAMRTKSVKTTVDQNTNKLGMVSEKIDTHADRLGEVAAVVEHTAESLDNHIKDERPLIEAHKASLDKDV